jgi:hypothetical protein
LQPRLLSQLFVLLLSSRRDLLLLLSLHVFLVVIPEGDLRFALAVLSLCAIPAMKPNKQHARQPYRIVRVQQVNATEAAQLKRPFSQTLSNLRYHP